MSELPSLAIKVDQAGYLTGEFKAAFLVQPVTGEPAPYTIHRRDDGKQVFKGRFTPPVPDPDSGDRVQTADFTSLDAPGTYYLEVPGVGKSWLFRSRQHRVILTFYPGIAFGLVFFSKALTFSERSSDALFLLRRNLLRSGRWAEK